MRESKSAKHDKKDKSESKTIKSKTFLQWENNLVEFIIDFIDRIIELIHLVYSLFFERGLTPNEPVNTTDSSKSPNGSSPSASTQSIISKMQYTARPQPVQHYSSSLGKKNAVQGTEHNQVEQAYDISLNLLLEKRQQSVVQDKPLLTKFVLKKIKILKSVRSGNAEYTVAKLQDKIKLYSEAVNAVRYSLILLKRKRIEDKEKIIQIVLLNKLLGMLQVKLRAFNLQNAQNFGHGTYQKTRTKHVKINVTRNKKRLVRV